jgi:hypothetical protein
VVKTTGYIEIPHTKAKNIACGFNRRDVKNINYDYRLYRIDY